MVLFAFIFTAAVYSFLIQNPFKKTNKKNHGPLQWLLAWIDLSASNSKSLDFSTRALAALDAPHAHQMLKPDLPLQYVSRQAHQEDSRCASTFNFACKPDAPAA